MEYPSEEIKTLYQQALKYDEQGDVYNAVKLYKRIIRLERSWSIPYRQLGAIYKKRQEWKACLHYHKKFLARDSSDRQAWWNLGIAASALNKWRIARNVWNKFGLAPTEAASQCIQLKTNNKFELFWVDTLDPARGQIKNIPFPASDRRYGDIILFDNQIVGYNVLNNKKMPIYPELGLYKRSVYRTWSCFLVGATLDDIKALERLCLDAALGFEVWSNASRAFSPQFVDSLPEYYSSSQMIDSPEQGIIVALAGKREKAIISTLNSWEVITLKQYTGLYHFK